MENLDIIKRSRVQGETEGPNHWALWDTMRMCEAALGVSLYITCQNQLVMEDWNYLHADSCW